MGRRRKQVGLFDLIFVVFSTLFKEAYRSGYKGMHGRYPKR